MWLACAGEQHPAHLQAWYPLAYGDGCDDESGNRVRPASARRRIQFKLSPTSSTAGAKNEIAISRSAFFRATQEAGAGTAAR